MRLLCTLALLAGLYSYAWGQQTCTFSGSTPELTQVEITDCLGASCSGCTVVIEGDRTISETIDLTGYPNLTFTIQQAASNAGGSLLFENRGSGNNAKNGALLLSATSTLVVEDTDDTSTNNGTDNRAALDGNLVSGNNQGLEIIRIGGMGYTPPQLDNIITSGGATEMGFGPLPIELISFRVESKRNRTQLSWRTATELNNDYMSVEHSTDGRRYTEIGRVLGAGTTQEPQDYSFVHEAPAPGLNYYRLRQVDYDGQYEYHGPVTARFSNRESVLDIFPTATADELTATYEGQLDTDATLSIQSTSGRILREWAWDIKSGRRTSFDVADLPAGWYVLRLRSGREVLAGRFLKQ